MNVLLVVPHGPAHYLVPPIGLAYLAASVRSLPVSVRVLDCVNERLPPPAFERFLAAHRPDVVGFQVFSCNVPVVRRNLEAVRRVCPSAVTVAGGAHPSALPVQTLTSLPQLDYAFRGEGEPGFPLLLRRLLGETALGLEGIPGLVWRADDGVRANPPSFVKDLDTLGFPAWDLVDPRAYHGAPQGVFTRDAPVASISTSRGCPYACTFCAAHTLMGRRLRVHSVEHVLREIEGLLTDHGIREIHIVDDHFTADRARVLAFCDGVRRRGLRFSFTFPNGVRLDSLDREVLDALRGAGCYSMIVGIESGCQRTLDRIQKKLTLPLIREKVALIRQAGIEVRAFFILGFPGETRAEIQATLDFARSLDLTAAQFSSFAPLPGTELARQVALSQGDGELQGLDFHSTPYVPEGLTRRELRALQRKAYLGFYLRPRVVARLLRQIQSPRHAGAILRRLVDYLR